MLEKVAFEVDEAEDGEEGLQILKQKKFNVILLDIHMPKLDGEQVMSILNKRKESLPVIVVSAYLSKERIIKLAQLGVKEFISKPFDLRTFYKIINKVYPLNIPEARIPFCVLSL